MTQEISITEALRLQGHSTLSAQNRFILQIKSRQDLETLALAQKEQKLLNWDLAIYASRGLFKDWDVKLIQSLRYLSAYLIPHDFDEFNAETLTVSEIHRFLEKHRSFNILFQACDWREYSQQADAAPSYQQKWKVSNNSQEIKVSVIIPTRNYGSFVVNSLRHILKQNLHPHFFEVIIVDDGGTDSTESLLKQLLSPSENQYNVQYIYVERTESQKDVFRAGHCRNIGSQHAQGQFLFFLDSDMLLPSDFLEGLVEQMQDCDILQVPRYHITPVKSDSYCNVEDLKAEDLYIEEESYWGPFFYSQQWASLAHHWRYTCTYGLCVHRLEFQKQNGFRKIFTSYGFEDTDLGYRWAKNNREFKLWKKFIYHLTPPKDQARYRHSIYRKQTLLSKTGKLFYLSCLDPEVYKLFWPYMQGQSRLKQFLLGLFKKN